MEALKIGSRREVCWDELLMDEVEGVRVQLHHPELRDKVAQFDMPWEGNVSGYFQILSDNNHLRLYYRGAQLDLDEDGEVIPRPKYLFCCAESKDGRSFQRPNLGIFPFWGQTDNNIIATDNPDNFFVFRDDNPACPPEEKYKALRGGGDQELFLYISPDGVHFEKSRVLVDDGAYDSLNVCLWNAQEQKYYLFYRGVHGAHTVNGKWNDDIGDLRHNDLVRDIRVRTSTDFVNWDEPRQIRFEPARDESELYTNQVQQYYRAKHMYIGFPHRYVDRYQDAQNFPHLPDWSHRQKLIRRWGRSGTAMTDSIVMTSRDGETFRRTDEAFLTAGPETDDNWYYGSAGIAYGMVETESDFPGGPREISLYVQHGYRVNPVSLYRYVIRLDGFFSWRCDYTPGRVVTHPFCFEGDHLSINFATSAAGYVRIRLLDADGAPIEGYDSGNLFGDSVDRAVEFGRPVEQLSGREIRMELSMRDADLYSFRFEKFPVIAETDEPKSPAKSVFSPT